MFIHSRIPNEKRQGIILDVMRKQQMVVPIVHLAPLHPAGHAQVFGAIQVPPFRQDVAPKHSAETKC